MAKCSNLRSICGMKGGIFNPFFQGFGSDPFALTNNSNLRLADGVLRPDGASGAGASITWAWLTVGGHGFEFFTGNVSISDGSIIIEHPAIFKMHAFQVRPDETLSNTNFHVEVEPINTTSSKITWYQQVGMCSGYAVGNGSGWDLFGDLTDFNFVTNSIDTLIFDPPKPYSNTGNSAQNANYWGHATAKYTGTVNGNKTVKLFTPTIDPGAFGYRIVDSSGVNIASNSSADIVDILTNSPKIIKVPASPNNANGWPGANIFTTSSNGWVIAFLEI